MRLFGSIIVALGLLLAAAGVIDPATAWWSQRARVEARASGHLPRFGSGFVGKLTIPRLETSLFLVDANSRRDLRRGPGYIEGSSRPGQPGNSIIAGHRDLHFRVLKDLRVGDQIEIESEQSSFHYRVVSIDIVSAADNGALRELYPEQLTLVTCYPFYYLGRAPKRFIVKAALQ